jgi:hypothetical protein
MAPLSASSTRAPSGLASSPDLRAGADAGGRRVTLSTGSLAAACARHPWRTLGACHVARRSAPVGRHPVAARTVCQERQVIRRMTSVMARPITGSMMSRPAASAAPLATTARLT